MSRRNPRLFDPKGLAPRVDPKRARRRHLQLADDPSEQLRLNRDGVGLAPGMTDGLAVRLVRPHSARKAAAVGADLGTVGRAMGPKWFKVNYIELFCGPGRLLDEDTGGEVPGSPIQALTIQSPFDRYVFSDYSDICADALTKRIEALSADGHLLPRTDVLRGDANDPDHLARVCSLIDPRALVIAYLDPAKPNLHWTTVEYLAGRFRFLDFIINLPFSGIHRSLAAGGDERPRLMLNHADPVQLLHPDPGRTAQNIRDHYDEQLEGIGFKHITRRCVTTDHSNSPLYDVVLASRNATAVTLFERANAAPAVELQTSLFDFID